MRKRACRPAGPVSVLGCQLRPANSFVEGAMWAAGRSLPEMSLAFALMAAINGSTGSRATLSFGLLGPSLVGVSPAAARFSPLGGVGASRQRHCPVNPRVANTFGP